MPQRNQPISAWTKFMTIEHNKTWHGGPRPWFSIQMTGEGARATTMRYLILSLSILFAIACHAAAPGRSKSATSTHKRGSSKAATTQKPQEVCLSETDLNSPRHTRLKSATTNPKEIIRVDLDGDGVPDLIETWWN